MSIGSSAVWIAAACVLFHLAVAADPPGKLWESDTLETGRPHDSKIFSGSGYVAAATGQYIWAFNALTGASVLRVKLGGDNSPTPAMASSAAFSDRYFCFSFNTNSTNYASCYDMTSSSYVFNKMHLSYGYPDNVPCSTTKIVKSSNSTAEHFLLGCGAGSVAISLPSGEIKLNLMSIASNGAGALLGDRLYAVFDIKLFNNLVIYDGASLEKVGDVPLPIDSYILCASANVLYLSSPMNEIKALDAKTGKTLWTVPAGDYGGTAEGKCDDKALIVKDGYENLGILFTDAPDILGPCKVDGPFRSTFYTSGLLLRTTSRPTSLTASAVTSCADAKKTAWKLNTPLSQHPGLVSVGQIPGAKNGSFAVFNNIGINFVDPSGGVSHALAGYRFAYYSGVSAIAIGGSQSSPLLFVLEGFDRMFNTPAVRLVASKIIPAP